MSRTADPPPAFFLNRDQIILVAIDDAGIAVTTALGMKILITGPPESLGKLVDDLINAVGSNFVSLTSPIAIRLGGAMTPSQKSPLMA